jgi:hypothetical protein
MSGSNNKTAVKMRASHYAALVEYEKLTGVSVEQSIEEALTDYLKTDSATAAGR